MFIVRFRNGLTWFISTTHGLTTDTSYRIIFRTKIKSLLFKNQKKLQVCDGYIQQQIWWLETISFLLSNIHSMLIHMQRLWCTTYSTNWFANTFGNIVRQWSLIKMYCSSYHHILSGNSMASHLYVFFFFCFLSHRVMKSYFWVHSSKNKR